jgi:hypothetical protein
MDKMDSKVYLENTFDCKHVDLIGLDLGEDGLGYYLSPRYKVEKDHEFLEVYIPKARLNLNRHRLEIYHDAKSNNPACNIGLGTMVLYADDDGFTYYEAITEHKPKEMTLEEIEKKLGHKVKIVSKEK